MDTEADVMAIVVEVEQSGNDLFIRLPEEVLARLKAGLGDTLELIETPNGLLLKALDDSTSDIEKTAA